jgi:hypothetical protein
MMTHSLVKKFWRSSGMAILPIFISARTEVPPMAPVWLQIAPAKAVGGIAEQLAEKLRFRFCFERARLQSRRYCAKSTPASAAEGALCRQCQFFRSP